VVNNPGKTISLKRIPKLVGRAHRRAFVPKNIISGFATTAICPYYPHVFDDSDFASAEVTNRPKEVQERPSTSCQT
jgi:hypothetical protein